MSEPRPADVSSAIFGHTILNDPLLNRGTAFTEEEREALSLRGLLPPAVETIEEQLDRALETVRGYDKPINQHVYLRALQDTNETLFFRLLTEHVEELLPIVYTPTVGEGCERFSQIYRRPRGLFVAYPDRDRIREVLDNRPRDHVDVIVVTDGERILGLGDQGAGGMGIPIGKLALYTAVGGIDPARVLPVLLDVGTDNAELRAAPRYLGWRHRRIGQRAYTAFVDAFVEAVEAEMPGVLLQWEDFASRKARPLLDRYRERMLTFNDDIQGTAAVVLGALSTATRLAGSSISEQQVVMAGAGSAAIGVLDMIRTAMVRDGLSDDQAAARIWVCDVDGLLTSDRRGLSAAQRRYARSAADIEGWDTRGTPQLGDVVRRARATCLIGLSTVGGLFTEPVVASMTENTQRPIVLPLSNPTSHSEADPADVMAWTGGQALVATGSPYPPVKVKGRHVEVAQSNNVYIFPAIGLAVTAARARRVTDAMLVAAAQALGEEAARLAEGDVAPLLPPIADLPALTRRIALAAGLAAVEDGVAPAATPSELKAAIWRTVWTPAYR